MPRDQHVNVGNHEYRKEKLRNEKVFIFTSKNFIQSNYENINLKHFKLAKKTPYGNGILSTQSVLHCNRTRRGFNIFVDHIFGTNCHMTWERVMKFRVLRGY